MYKFAMIKDPHFKFGFSISHRKNYDKDITNKIKNLIEIMKENDVTDLFIPGDIFDESYGNRWRFQAYQINKMILSKLFSGINIYTIPGNHDYFDGYEDSCMLFNTSDDNIYQFTVYGDFVHDGLMKDVSHRTNHPDSIHRYENDEIYLTGVRYRSNIEDVISELEEINSIQTDRLKVVMLHQNVTPNRVNHITEFTYDELSKYNIDVFLLGHYHIGYEPKVINNTLFINPYNFTRVARTYETRLDKHIPEVAIITVDNNKIIDVKQIKLKVKPFKETFISEYISFMEAVSKTSNIDEKLSLEILESQLSDSDIIKLIADKNGFNKEVIDYVIEKLNEIE